MKKFIKECEDLGVAYEYAKDKTSVLKNGTLETLETKEYLISKVTSSGYTTYQIVRYSTNKVLVFTKERPTALSVWKSILKKSNGMA